MGDLIGEIASATAEPTIGIGQMGDAVTQLDRAARQTAALVAASATSADNLRRQSAALADLVSLFKLNWDEAARALARAPRGPPPPWPPPRRTRPLA